MLGADLTTAEYIKKYASTSCNDLPKSDLPCPYRSLFASFFGNITAALFVGLPAVYFWLQDYVPAGIHGQAEEGLIDAMPTQTNSSSRSDNVVKHE